MDVERINSVLIRAIGQFQEGEIVALASLTEKKESRGQAIKKAGKLDAIDPLVAKSIVHGGLKDGNIKDDKIVVAKKQWPASSLRPSQTTMVLDKSLGMALFMIKSGKIGGDLGALVSADKQIMDGHHRWSATILASGSRGKVGGYGANMKGKQLLRVLNLLTKGKFNVRGGKAGKGSLATYTPDNVRSKMNEFVKKGIGGKFPWSPDDVKETLKKGFGSVKEGIDTMAKNADLIPKKVPNWAPDRKQMPVIEPTQVPAAAKSMTKGEIDWRPPFAKGNDR